MKQLLQKTWLAAMLPALALALLAALTGQLLLRNLSLFLSFEPMLQGIFAQLKTAAMWPSVVLLLIAYPLQYWTLWLYRKHQRKALPIAITACCFPLVTVVGMLTTHVNGILFWDVVVSLLELIRKGGLAGL